MRKKKPRRLFRRNMLPSELQTMVDVATQAAPELRPTLYEALTAIAHPEIVRMWADLAPARRGCLVLALPGACVGLFEKRSCDFCERTASKVRPVVIPPAADFGPVKRSDDPLLLAAFLILCDNCVELDEKVRQSKYLEKHAVLQQEAGKLRLGRRPGIIGQPVGGATVLGRRSALQSCERCSQSIWFDEEQLEKDGLTPAGVSFICPKCADHLRNRGMLEDVPQGFDPPFKAAI